MSLATSLVPTPTATPASGKTVFSLRLAPKRGNLPILHPRFEQALNNKTHSRAVANNSVLPLFDGQNSFAERNKLIAGAKTSINLQTFIFTDDDTGWDLARRLVERAKDGVAVRVIIDGLGSNRSDDKIFEFMRAGGVEVRAHETGLDLLSVNNRWHEKHFIVDGQVAVEGGMNIADEYSLGGSGRQVFRAEMPAMDAWRDVDVRVGGPAVADIQRAFLRNWALLGAPVPRDKVGALFPPPKQTLGGPPVRVVQHHPHGDPPDDHTVQLYLHAFNAASTSITIENAYFIPPQLLRDALVDAAKRGVEVKVLTNSKSSSDMSFLNCVGDEEAAALAAAFRFLGEPLF
jgi:cardiolipin synthase